jgi:hypothetical protein
MSRWSATTAVLVLCSASALAAEPTFVAGPAAKAEANGVRIEFEVNAPTDVAVAVLDAKGAVVRHLLAAMLKPDALKQSLLWDRTDDDGKPATGEVSVRVGLGLAPKLDRVLGFDGNALTNLVGLAVNAQGEVFVLTTESTYGRSMIRVLDRNGKYARTVMPYNAQVCAQRAAQMGQLKLDGRPIPIVFNGHGHNLLPMTSGMKHQNMLVLPNGNLVFASAVGTIVEHVPMRHLLAIAPDGGEPTGMTFIGPEIRRPLGMRGGTGEGGSAFFDHLASSPDGQALYYSTWSDSPWAKPRHVVYRLAWTDAELAKPFLGELDKPGADDAHFNDPQGLAVDAAGRLYVCDRGNGRVMVFSADGKLVGQFAAADPEQIAVHPKTGAVFVLSRKEGKKETAYTLRAMSAFDGTSSKELAALPGTGSSVVMALDPSAEGGRVWIALRSRLFPITFDGRQFIAGADVLSRRGLDYPMFVAADGERQCTYVGEYKERIRRIDLATGEVTDFKKGIEPFVGRDGNVHLLTGYQLVLERYTPKGAPLPFSALGTHQIKIPTVSKGPSVGVRGAAVDRQGRIYLNEMAFYSVGNVFVYQQDGKKDSEPVVKRLIHGSSGLALDPAGNIYVGSNLKPAEHPYPDSLASQLPAQGWVWWRWTRGAGEKPREGFWKWPYYLSYLYHWGSVLKFPPAGGEYFGGMAPHEIKAGDPPPPAAPEGAPRYKSAYLNLDTWVKGALWVHQGMGPIPASGLNWGDPSCTCWTSRLAVDEFGRVFVPNVFTYSVDVLDTNGTPIARIGRYGNADDRDAIAWAWPAFVSHSRGKVYVSDPLNGRVTAVSLGVAVEKIVPVTP